MRKIHFSDHLEKEVAEVLESKGIDFVHESEGNSSNLDFYLPAYDVFIEVKQFHSDRVVKQLASKDNVIVIQGKKSIAFLKSIL
jgi:hypothetical protein